MTVSFRYLCFRYKKVDMKIICLFLNNSFVDLKFAYYTIYKLKMYYSVNINILAYLCIQSHNPILMVFVVPKQNTVY